MKIKDILVREIFNSRAEPTLEISLSNEKDEWFSAQIPSGKSKGKNEAAVINYTKAQEILEQSLKKQLNTEDFNSIEELDSFLITLDGTENKSKLGGNLTLGISIAFARALAHQNKKELWQLLNEEFFDGASSNTKPLIFSNLINGGAHANNNLYIQEYLVIVKITETVVESIKKLISFYRNLEEFLKEKTKIKNLPIGEEGGFAVNFNSNFEPIEILENLIYKLKLEKEFTIGLDVAANSFYQEGKYTFEGNQISSKDLKEIYSNYFRDSKLLHSIEDPFAEEDFEGFKELKELLKTKLIVGDDITVTNPSLINKVSVEGLINGVIIKPNQIGTITETILAIKAAQENNLKFIVSHRSGETEDNFIIQLAKASNADGVKIGAPLRERIFKFNELIRLYKGRVHNSN